MKYRVVVTTDDEQFVAVVTDDLYLASFIADNLERHPFYNEIFIEKESEK